jgi:tRNA-2-methylthio-N6-dimethylallyladenosine synthase
VVNFATGPQAATLLGQLVDVRITQSFNYTLRGELLASADTIADVRKSAS